MCKRLLILDTHCSLDPKERGEFRGRSYYGHSTIDHYPHQTTTESRKGNSWSSLDSDFVFFMSKNSLINLMVASGFSTVCELAYPYYEKSSDRIVLAGVKVPATSVKVFHNPALALLPVPESVSGSPAVLIPGHQYADGNPQTTKLPDKA
jgi:hypothetical protein